MNNAFLALTAAGFAGLSGFGINAQTSPVQTAQVVNSTPDYTQEAGVFSQWLSSDAPQCVAVSKIGSVAHLTKLTHEQFQFVRALYVAIPPISRALPPGRQRCDRELEWPLYDRAGLWWRNLRALPCSRFRFVDAHPSRQRRDRGGRRPDLGSCRRTPLGLDDRRGLKFSLVLLLPDARVPFYARIRGD